jgi:hypothetical protein
MLVEVAEELFEVPFNDKLYKYLIPALLFRFCRRHAALNAADIVCSLERDLPRPRENTSRSTDRTSAREGMDVMRITKSIFGMLAVTAYR